jgi:hypothetical protein
MVYNRTQNRYLTFIYIVPEHNCHIGPPTPASYIFPSRSRIHERTISLSFLGMIFRGLRLEVSVYKVYIANCHTGPSTPASCIFPSRSRIHERTVSLRFLGIILRVFRLEVSVYNFYMASQFQITFARGGRGGDFLPPPL